MMFLVLVTIAFGLFAPSVILPVLRDHCQLREEERRLAAYIARLEEEVARRSDLAYAFEYDAIINERLAVLDLRYTNPNEVVVPIPAVNVEALDEPSGSRPPADAAAASIVLPADWPAWSHRAEGWFTQRGLTRLFLDERLRPVFLLMAGGLLIAAFVVFAPRRRRAAAVHGPRSPVVAASQPQSTYSSSQIIG
jgi:hypothetical protein